MDEVRGKRFCSELRSFPNAVWSTYGMTETLSHIALRRLSGAEASDWYTPFPSVTVNLSDEGTLVVDKARQVCERVLARFHQPRVPPRRPHPVH